MELTELSNEELDNEIVYQIAIDDLKYYTNQNMKENFINNILGDINNDNNIIDNLVDAYKKGSPYIGYYNKYLIYKKKLLKEKFDIEFDIPDENNILSID